MAEEQINQNEQETEVANPEDLRAQRLRKMQAIKDAPRTIYGEIQKAKRVLNIPDIEYESDELVYKPFFIVECLNDDKEVFHILFDAVTGDFSLLNA